MEKWTYGFNATSKIEAICRKAHSCLENLFSCGGSVDLSFSALSSHVLQMTQKSLLPISQ